MRSQLEVEVSERIRHVRSLLEQTDRFVVVGLLLAFIPVFPACFVGLLISLANLYLLKTGRLLGKNLHFIVLGVLAGALFSCVWALVFTLYSPIYTFSHILDHVRSVLDGVLFFGFPDPVRNGFEI